MKDMLFKRKEKNGCWKELAAVADRVRRVENLNTP